VLGAVVTTAAAGLLGLLLPADVVLVVAAAVAAYALGWHAIDAHRFPGSRSGRQANRRWATRTRLGRVYFGGILGLGLATQMTTPLVYALVAFAMAVHFPLAVAAGVGFGLGRSRPVLTGLRWGDKVTPAAVAARFTHPARSDRLIGCGVAAALLATAVAQVA
jgi:hypothetical protein